MVFQVLLGERASGSQANTGPGVAVDFDLIQPVQAELLVFVRLKCDAALIQPGDEVKVELAFDEVLIL